MRARRQAGARTCGGPRRTGERRGGDEQVRAAHHRERAREALAFARGETSEGFVAHEFDNGDSAVVDREAAMPLDLHAIRDRLGLSQADFARRFGFGLAALRGWEQGRSTPAGPARVLCCA